MPIRLRTFAYFALLGFLAAHASADTGAAIRVDQAGYLPAEVKAAMVAESSTAGLSAKGPFPFHVRRVKDGQSVLSGALGQGFVDAASGDPVRRADFSSLTVTGTYYLEVAGLGESDPFSIGPAVYALAWNRAIRSFYGQRCGSAVDLGTVDGTHYAHAACHVTGPASDLPSTYDPSSGKQGTRATPKGWHDAGDYGKYVVNSGISTGELLWTYEWWKDRIGAVENQIPESGNGCPDVLNEARWNLEWMLTMQDDDGGVWPKNTSAGFGGFTLPEDDDAGTRLVIGTGGPDFKTTCATADFAAVLGCAARLFQPFDATFSARCLAAAERAFAWATLHPDVGYEQPPNIRTGAYGGKGRYGNAGTLDERLWAAAELFRSTGTQAYSDYVVAHAPAGPLLKGDGDPQEWMNVMNLALWAYYFSGRPTADAALCQRIRDDTLASADPVAARSLAPDNGYQVSLKLDQYVWGSNAIVANYGIWLLVADRLQPKAAYRQAALDDLHYLLGRNCFGTSFVTHVGTRACLHPHHRPSGSPAYKALAPWPGLLTGGPNATGCGADHLTPESLYPAQCWIDATGSYASNENSINGQAALVFLLAAFQPVPPAVGDGGD